MTESTIAVVALVLLGWASVSGVLARHDVTGPLVFAVVGYVLANPDWGPLEVHVEASGIHIVAEVTLALVLFADAARVNVHELRRDLSIPVRLLGIGLLLSVLLGGLLADWMFDFPWALAGFVGAALAPTDAALSVQVINDERIPLRLRRALNVESGLNDGIVTPIVTFTVAIAASQLGIVHESESFEAGAALRDLGWGLVIGVAVGVGGALLISIAARHGWIAHGGRRLATLAIAIAAFTVALAFEANGFIAAFVAGIAFGAMVDRSKVDLDEAIELPELGGELLALVVWFLFGAALVPIAIDDADGWVIAYALLSLTLVRMVPVALGLVGSGLDGPSTIFVGWFGPRGLASVVFALLAVEELGESSTEVGRAIATVTITVLFSVVLHGITAGPGGRRYVEFERVQPSSDEALRSRRSSLARTPSVRTRVGNSDR